jgi:peroxiredoxin
MDLKVQFEFYRLWTVRSTSKEAAMKLQERLDAAKAAPAHPNFRDEFKTIAARTINMLIASGQAERALKAGDRMPSFVLPDQDGVVVSSAGLLEKGPLVLSFYRGVWCPFCNIELQALQEAITEIRARGASLVAVSQQTPTNNLKSRRENRLEFPILSDKGGVIGAAFGIRWVIPEEMRVVHRQLGGPIPHFNGEESWTLPMPARYVIGQDGIIVHAEVNPDYTKRPEPSDLFPILARLRQSAAILQEEAPS